MNTAEFQEFTNKRLANTSTDKVREMYAEIRTRVVGARAISARPAKGESETMLAIGNVLESRIGEDAFYKLLDELDGFAPATTHD